MGRKNAKAQNQEVGFVNCSTLNGLQKNTGFSSVVLGNDKLRLSACINPLEG